MKVLIGCEYSATVRDAFRARGHDAWSCDLRPTEGDPQWHIQDDLFHVLAGTRWSLYGWDLAIFHPTCTFAANSGAKHLYNGMKKSGGINQDRWAKMEESTDFFRAVMAANIPRIAVENPIPHRHALERIGRRYDQIIQPWQFGHPESKATCLWLEGLPELQPTKIVYDEMMALPKSERNRIHYMPPGPNRQKERARFYQGFADAMADQWGILK